MWKQLSESVAGTSHHRTGAPCQDRCWAISTQPRDEIILVAACADGAGSASLSDVGAQLACQTFVQAVSSALQDGLELPAITQAKMVDWYQQVHRAIGDEAEQRELTPRDLACTLLTAIVGEHDAVFAQVGDGSIVLLDGDNYLSVFWPQAGEYANVTNFITQPGFEKTMEFVFRSARIDELALFTDGLQRLALSYSDKTVHQAFFAPMFSSLRAAANADELIAPLRTFLDSPAVNERTDDDKTLVLATRVNGGSAS